MISDKIILETAHSKSLHSCSFKKVLGMYLFKTMQYPSICKSTGLSCQNIKGIFNAKYNDVISNTYNIQITSNIKITD